ncbi:MAG: shikimate dehydrogenase [Mycobacterium sp.]|nr:shikimate dehydrogenase [Mycobacterium sp.]
MTRKAAVLGSPIAHSRSPQLHLAAYRALGLVDWTYERIECTGDELPSLVGGFGPEWVGLSVTMPGKFAALRFADERTFRAEQIGSANTLVRTSSGWRADNTDIDGVTGALGAVFGGQERSDRGIGIGGQERSDRGRNIGGQERSDSGMNIGTAAVLGSGGTAPAAVAGLAELGVQEISIVARNRDKASALLELGTRLGVETRWVELGTPLTDVGVVVNTIPADVAARYADTVTTASVLLDAIYDPWPTPLAEAFAAGGGRVISGLQMLLNQAFAQVEQFTGQPAPKEAMIASLG